MNNNLVAENMSSVLGQDAQEQDMKEDLAVSVSDQSKAALYAVGLGLLNLGRMPDKKENKGFMSKIKSELQASLGREGAEEIIKLNHDSVMMAFTTIKQMYKGDKKKIKEARERVISDFKRAFAAGKENWLNKSGVHKAA